MSKSSYHIFVIGCWMNNSDSERLAGYLSAHGLVEEKDINKADVVFFTTCGVRQSAEDRVYGLIPRVRKFNPKATIVLTGCLVGRDDVRKRLAKAVDIWLPIAGMQSLGELLKLKKKKEKEVKNYLTLMPKIDSEFSAFVPIGNGCDNFCTYCVVPYARGREVYRPAEEIVAEVRGLVERGYKEIILIAQNVNSYNSRNTQRAARDKSVDFADLLRQVNDIDGNFWIRFATSHPKDMSDKLISAIASCEKVCEHVHLPVQAGDNEILRAMNRKYSREHYLGLIRKIVLKISKSKIQNPKTNNKNSVWQPPVSISTDIIVGFPGETRKQFLQTAKIFREVGYDMAFISQYSVRPGTAAEKLVDNITKAEKMKREQELNDILSKTALANNKKYLKKTVEVLVEGRNRKGEWVGKTRTNKTVSFPVIGKEKLVGDFVKVKITSVMDFGLRGEFSFQ